MLTCSELLTICALSPRALLVPCGPRWFTLSRRGRHPADGDRSVAPVPRAGARPAPATTSVCWRSHLPDIAAGLLTLAERGTADGSRASTPRERLACARLVVRRGADQPNDNEVVAVLGDDHMGDAFKINERGMR